MAPKATRKQSSSPAPDPDRIFASMVVFLVAYGVQTRRLQIWKQKLVQMGATIVNSLSKKVTHVFAINSDALLHQVGRQGLGSYERSVLLYQWVEDSLRVGVKVAEDLYRIRLDSEGESTPDISLVPKSISEERSHRKKKRSSLDDVELFKAESRPHAPSPANIIPKSPIKDSSLPYSPPDLNKNINEIFGKLIRIYRALGDDRRSFSYYKAIGVIEKLPFKIESGEQVKDLPAIGKSIQDHIQEIVTTGKLSKLEHFETDEKVRTISLFGEVWGIGPATALKLYEKGHRTLDDLKDEDSLTNSQRLGLKYFDEIGTRIPRHEVQEMVKLLQKVGEDILPGVFIVCGGSYRRGKASCGDLDIVVTHPDGKSHKGFLSKYVKRLKDLRFLREDLVFSTHSEEGTDSGVDTYFGLCTYPGRELRHRIDFKVYPRDIHAFGLIAWTGNDVLNRRLRLLAESKGYRLDDTGLFPATQGSGGKLGVRASTSLKLETEKEVFDFLEFPWLEPEERNM
ncbi:NTP_transf_2 domain-containing protein/DNA_pol_lambd_f domain-containing protein [Cephalotus follicularis]|uniref:DNA polymerase n=1 Tax=Cephalotus follicularis TaxID=3775 RepID=A0A1Q3DD56_CEPFO|nr:NTP_transf_2 domain-containing protein/DNA_pol_lambd_f domain-containing protein [Cephalotus follicularis]